jgi:hypothetical protein
MQDDEKTPLEIAEERLERLAPAIATHFAEYALKVARSLLPNNVPRSEVRAYAATFLFAGGMYADKEMIQRVVKAGAIYSSQIPVEDGALEELTEIISSAET